MVEPAFSFLAGKPAGWRHFEDARSPRAVAVAALLPPSWECRLVNRNTEKLTEAELEWADLVMTGGMMPQRPDTLTVIALAQTRGKPVVVGGPDATSSPFKGGEGGVATFDCVAEGARLPVRVFDRSVDQPG